MELHRTTFSALAMMILTGCAGTPTEIYAGHSDMDGAAPTHEASTPEAPAPDAPAPDTAPAVEADAEAQADAEAGPPVSDACVPVPQNIACYNRNCGNAADGCGGGGKYDCGSCSSGQFCSGAMTNIAGVCEQCPADWPCSAYECGHHPAEPGCPTNDCGPCPDPATECNPETPSSWDMSSGKATCTYPASECGTQVPCTCTRIFLDPQLCGAGSGGPVLWLCPNANAYPKLFWLLGCTSSGPSEGNYCCPGT